MKSSGAQLATEASEDGSLHLRLSGRLDVFGISWIWEEMERRLRGTKAGTLVLDTRDIVYCDTAGAAMLVHCRREAEALGREVTIRGFPEDYRPLLDMLEGGQEAPSSSSPRPSFFADLGKEVLHFGGEFVALLRATGEVTLAMGRLLLRPLSLRLRDFRDAVVVAGVNALPITLVVAFLLGLILSYQTAQIFARFGAETYLATMIGLSFFRELGPLMTAIVLTARSGSSFAAELGTMKVNSEVDALNTMGIEPVHFLITPRLLAAVLMTPLLVVFADLAGVLGGFVVWSVNLDLTWWLYRERILEAVTLGDFLGGLFKALVFGLLVVGVACIRGLETAGASRAVGRSATRAVVSGIVLIALADALLSWVYFNLGI